MTLGTIRETSAKSRKLSKTRNSRKEKFFKETYGCVSDGRKIFSDKEVRSFSELHEAIIFDFDGVIASTASAFRQAFWAFLRKRHIRAVMSDFEDHGSFTKSLKQSVEILRTKYGCTIDPQNMRDELVPVQLELLEKHLDFDPSLHILLEYCQQAGIKIAIGSNSYIDRINWVIKKMHIEKYFLLDQVRPKKGRAILSAEDITHHKPDPEVWLRCAKMLEVPIEKCLIIEDGLPGLLGAKTCGAQGVYYHRFCSFNKACRKQATMTIKSFSELLFDLQ